LTFLQLFFFAVLGFEISDFSTTIALFAFLVPLLKLASGSWDYSVPPCLLTALLLMVL
jgi:hypothetical protein